MPLVECAVCLCSFLMHGMAHMYEHICMSRSGSWHNAPFTMSINKKPYHMHGQLHGQAC